MSYHVRDVLASVQDRAPAPHTTTDDIIARARRIRARRRTAIAATGGAAAVLAVVVVAVVGLRPPRAEVPPVTVPVPPKASRLLPAETFSTLLGTYRSGATRIGPVGQVTATFQQLPVYPDGESWKAEDGRHYPLSDGLITVYRPGAYEPEKFGVGEPAALAYGATFPVTVAGRPGVGREVRGSGAGPATKYVRTALAWQYEPGAWATYVPQYLLRSESRQQALRVAAAVVPQRVRPIRAPFRLDFVPTGWQTVTATETPVKTSNEVSDVSLSTSPADVKRRSLRIVVTRGQPKDAEIRGRDGVHCYPSPDPSTRGVPYCLVIRGQYFAAVQANVSGLSATVVRQIVDGLKLVDETDQQTWVPVDR